MKRALSIRAERLEGDAPETHEAAEALVDLYEELGMEEQAVDCLREHLERLEDALGADHEEVTAIQDWIDEILDEGE